ncbi:LysR substrate-binding domain-containing protein [Burkholderia lata]|uniref:Transcriptional regulator, LysR family n=1 Tax=Burkholderia lata (strain ATCC 17760 / DSM 23089 / LMG 22485 / NCIMB 9086 / R18194 / 383) TaxID=482957 RepID=Q39GA6_BURL3|nr:LysR substrate-binding domain-containing protein [Burkholderia lata]ABB08510.1 transcriptional regulator, LysR family [Burkholderia lata]
MLDLNDFRYFVRIVESGGLTAASRNLDIPKSTVSHRLQQLEAALGVRLINRTSRSLSVTDAGQLFYSHAVTMLERAEVAENAVRERLVEPIGTIRFTTAVATSLYAMRQILPDFIKRYPKIDVIEHVSDEQTDIVGGNFDLALRAHNGPLSDSALVQRKLAPAPWFLFASPDYLDRRGQPVAPDELAGHDSLFVTRHHLPFAWKLKHPSQGEVSVPLKPRLAGNDLVTLKQAAQDGLGVVALPGYVCRDEVRSGALRCILPDWLAGEATITAVLPFRHGMLPSVRVFLDFLVERIPKVVS